MDISSLIEIKTFTYIPVASTSLLVYDYFLTLPQEISLVWMSPWNLYKFLFFLTRYPMIMTMSLGLYRNVALSVPHCKFVDVFTDYTSIIWISVAEVVMAARVWALWQRNFSIGVFLAFLITGLTVVSIVAEARYSSVAQYVMIPPEVVHFAPGCHDFVTPEFSSTLFQAPYISVMIVETLVLMLMLARSISHYKMLSHSRFLLIFYQDGVMYFVILAVVAIVNIIVVQRAPPELANLCLSLQRALHPILSARILLHMREENQRDRAYSSTINPSLGSLAFGRPTGRDQDGTLLTTRWTAGEYPSHAEQGSRK